MLIVPKYSAKRLLEDLKNVAYSVLTYISQTDHYKLYLDRAQCSQTTSLDIHYFRIAHNALCFPPKDFA